MSLSADAMFYEFLGSLNAPILSQGGEVLVSGSLTEVVGSDTEYGSDSDTNTDTNESVSERSQIVIRERYRFMYRELLRKPTDEDVISLVKAQIRNEWFTDDGETFSYRNMTTGKPEGKMAASELSLVLFSAEYALRDMAYRRSKFDTLLLPELQLVLDRRNISSKEKVKQLLFLRHHSPVAIRPKVPRVVNDVPFGESFAYEWERRRRTTSDRLIDRALEDLTLTPVAAPGGSTPGGSTPGGSTIRKRARVD